MLKTLPGTTVEVSRLEKGRSRQLFDGIFAAGGITLSQVCIITGLEPYLVQNWVKRGFVSSPQKRVYSREEIVLEISDIFSISELTPAVPSISDVLRSETVAAESRS